MENHQYQILFIGAGSIATSLGHVMARNPRNRVKMLSIEPEVVKSVNESHVNNRYFPNIPLHPGLQATVDESAIGDADILFLAIPSVETVQYIRSRRHLIGPGTVIVNLAKGFGENNLTIIESLAGLIGNPLVVMKGPTFARDIINNQPTAFTVGTQDHSLFKTFLEIFEGTTVYLDHSDDVKGVEILSLLKNIYAIVIGIADANFDAPNLRFLLLTRAFKEMRRILLHFGGREETIFRYCGIGDFSLTALNDLSRNRTLGLLIGKGFFTKDISDKVILEGKIAVNVICEEVCKAGQIGEFPIIRELYNVFNDHYDISSFVNRLLSFEDKA
jgi:glycerol-3-phosphate dehydrogenase (NAD(P)+)